MENIIVKPSDLWRTTTEKNYLYKIYGKEFTKKIPEIYETLANILNSNDTFSKMIYKSINDNGFYDISLKEIYKMLENYKNDEFYPVYNAITENLFNDYSYYLLQKYVISKEPALTDCRGVNDIPQCDFIIEKYHEFLDSLNVEATPSMPTIDENGKVIINRGDLYHGTAYIESTVESIASRGLESGQLHGIMEDGETFFCVDFFKATKDSTVDEICTRGKHYTNGRYQIVFIINHKDIEGPKAMFPNLTDYDAYNINTERGRKAREFINVNAVP